MDDIVFGALFLFVIVGFVTLFPLTITSCVAWSRTREWRKEKAKHFAKLNGDVEMDGLISEDEESEEEPLDSEDEAEIMKRKEAKKADWELTTHQKYKKEMRKIWAGEDAKEAVAKKEREERAKVAREVAREMLRVERRREKKMKTTHGKAQEAMEDRDESENSLPTYDVATASSS